MIHRFSCLLLSLTPIIGYGQTLENEKIRTISYGINASNLQSTKSVGSSLSIPVAFAMTVFHARKPIFGSKTHRLTTSIGFDGGAPNPGVSGSYGLSQTTRIHQIVLSAGFRLADIPSLFAQFHLLLFPLKRIGILGINARVHLKLSRKETFGQADIGITLFSTRKYK